MLIWLLSALVGALAVPSSASAAPAGCGMRQQLETFHLEVKVDKPKYRVGDVAKVHVTVTRPGDKDPAGEGQELPISSPVSHPAEGVDVGMNLFVPDSLPIVGFAPLTDENGQTTIEAKLDRSARRGVVQANVIAVLKYPPAPAGCVEPEEYGFVEIPKPFKVVS